MRIRPLLSYLTCIGVTASALGVVVTEPATAQHAPVRTEWREIFSPDGTIRRLRVTREVHASPAPRARVAAAEVIPIEVNGPSESRFDLVFVGDGYTASELGAYGGHVRGKFDEIMAKEPFRSHRKQFNVWQVNVVSQQSGVDNDPTQGIQRATALDMGFWCGGIQRLLCVNETKARQYAAAARDVDQVLALGNSTTYGGAGGTVATASGGNAQSGEVAIHEMGHSVGGLADEYSDGQGDVYRGPEPRELNVSTYTREQMRQNQTKWARFLGQPTPDGGVIDTFEGGYYHRRGIYRPSENSIMRTLGREFNLPGREAMIAAFYREKALPTYGE
ncbi:hypothetical protein E1287_33370 [Actinomadura sp. KC06]|uniref:M64 family metallopeptidase n=1 Tax=Actinomadura sp. KC06 TaxID=2530369 RepID=UPI00104669B6|nr:M64 family metallopeptidase [Actinomadura sp. KC06]TDD28092.1 hypothetical protein E1287_33370 [Actinomadura sp. KC06]